MGGGGGGELGETGGGGGGPEDIEGRTERETESAVY